MDKLTGVNEKGEKVEFEVTPEGNIGLLAAGAVGVLLWKKARKAAGLPDFSDPTVPLKFQPVKRKKKVEKKEDEEE